MQGRDGDRCTDRTDFHETAARTAHFMRQSVELGHYHLPLSTGSCFTAEIPQVEFGQLYGV